MRTGDAAADENAADINEQIGGFLTPALLAFAGAALLVGAFIIFNTFTITVAERTREFALLRTLGATRAQILGAVALEALVDRPGRIRARPRPRPRCSPSRSPRMFEAVGLGIPTGGLELAPRTIAVSLLVGVGVTQLAALAPARRATRVAPIAALQGQEQQSARRRWAPWIAGIVAVARSRRARSPGCSPPGPAASRLSMMAVGVVLLFVGVALSARWFVRPLAGAIGWPLERLFAEPGLLARENAMRNPGRTATTAAALMVGLGLVVFVAVFANGIKASFDETVNQVVNADLIVRSETMEPIPAGAEQRRGAHRPTSAPTTGVLIDQVKVNGKGSNVLTDIMNGVDPADFARLYGVDWVRRRRLRCSSGCAATPRSSRSSSPRPTTSASATPTGSRRRRAGKARLRVIGVYRDPQLLQGTIVPQDLFGAHLGRARPLDHLRRRPRGRRRRSGQAPRRSGARGLPDRRGRVAAPTTPTRSAPSSTSSSTCSTRCSP